MVIPLNFSFSEENEGTSWWREQQQPFSVGKSCEVSPHVSIAIVMKTGDITKNLPISLDVIFVLIPIFLDWEITPCIKEQYVQPNAFDVIMNCYVRQIWSVEEMKLGK